MEPDVYIGYGCSLWDQNCPPGEKCAPWADDGGNSWNGFRCVPVAPDPGAPGDACTVQESGVSGLDDCDAHSMCFDVDENLQGECHAYCVGSENNPLCTQPDHACAISGDGVLTLCMPLCDPLMSDCGPSETCVPMHVGFVCAPDASGPDDGAAGDSCEFVNACDPGFVCANPTAVGTCAPGSSGCCTAVCDVTNDDCAKPQVCEPWFELGTAPYGQENVGVCLEAT